MTGLNLLFEECFIRVIRVRVTTSEGGSYDLIQEPESSLEAETCVLPGLAFLGGMACPHFMFGREVGLGLQHLKGILMTEYRS